MGKSHVRATKVLKGAEVGYPILEITKHAASEYADLRKLLAVTYLPSLLRSQRPRWVDQWVLSPAKNCKSMKTTYGFALKRGTKSRTDSTDEDMVIRISKADAGIKFRFIKGH